MSGVRSIIRSPRNLAILVCASSAILLYSVYTHPEYFSPSEVTSTSTSRQRNNGRRRRHSRSSNSRRSQANGVNSQSVNLDSLEEPHLLDIDHIESERRRELSDSEDEEEMFYSDNFNENDNEMRATAYDRYKSILDSHQDVDEREALMSLLYAISLEKSRKNAYVHRGVSCNACRTSPIKGVRYQCTQCADVDLCEKCEALDRHSRGHVLYKIKIPIPVLFLPDPIQKKFYPGQAYYLSRVPPLLSRDQVEHFSKMTYFDDFEVEALYEQFKTLLSTDYPNDPDSIGAGIDAPTLKDVTSKLRDTPNLVTERIFSLYDTDRNGIIGFAEYINGISVLWKGTRKEKLRKVFAGYDLDDDGRIKKQDLLEMFADYFELSNNLVGFIVRSIDEEFRQMQGDVVSGSQPISSIFQAPIPSTIELPPSLTGGESKDDDAPWQIGESSDPVSSLSLAELGSEDVDFKFHDMDAEAELRKIAMSAVDDLVTEIFMVAEPKNPELGLTWEEFSSVALKKSRGIYLGFLCSWIDHATF
ncbi:hypothetical protein V1511DRAFT_493572 [Dipodascopsis uninucleata]